MNIWLLSQQYFKPTLNNRNDARDVWILERVGQWSLYLVTVLPSTGEVFYIFDFSNNVPKSWWWKHSEFIVL